LSFRRHVLLNIKFYQMRYKTAISQIYSRTCLIPEFKGFPQTLVFQSTGEEQRWLLSA